MSDFKSKLPDFKELTSMTGKLYKGLKTSVEEIVHDYKLKRAVTEVDDKPTQEVKKETKSTKNESAVKAEKPEDPK